MIASTYMVEPQRQHFRASPEPASTRLRALLAEIWDLRHVTWLLEWDQQCFQPPAAGEGRAEQLGTLQRLVHERLTSDELGREIDRLAVRTRGLDPEADEVRLAAVRGS